MAYQLQKVIILTLVAGAALAAPRRPFSHKYHLTQVAACESCHTQAANSTSAADNLLPDKSACVTCHDEVEIPAPRRLAVQKFNHAKHVAMGSIAPLLNSAIRSKTYLGTRPPSAEQLAAGKDACTSCHHGIAESENVPHDKPVAAHFPAMADCLVCHNKIDPPDSCEQCHAKPQSGFKPATHTAEFSDKHATKSIEKAECATCHGRKFTCKGCH